MYEKYFVYKLSTLDFFIDCTIPIQTWLEKDLNNWTIFIEAIVAFSKHSYNDYNLRLEPRVGFDILTDSIYFIFKLDNNGVVYIVSETELPHLTTALT